MSRRGNRGAVRTGFEPATSCVTGRHSSQAELPDQHPTGDLLRAMTLIEVIKIRELVLQGLVKRREAEQNLFLYGYDK